MSGELKNKMNVEQFREYLAKKDRAQDSKYKAIPTETADGQKFRSQLEADYYNRMWVLQRAGQVTKIEREVRYELIVNGVFICAYLLDFKITYADGHVDHVDCKSAPTMTALYRVKKQLMKALHEIDLIEVFEQAEEFVNRRKPKERGKK